MQEKSVYAALERKIAKTITAGNKIIFKQRIPGHGFLLTLLYKACLKKTESVDLKASSSFLFAMRPGWKIYVREQIRRNL